MADDVNRNDVVLYPATPGARWSELINRISWGAIWAGVLIALGMEALFALFGLFIGFGMYQANAANPWAGISAWTTVWYLVTAGWSMFFGAWCAARLAGNPVREAAILHGITTWGFAATVTMAILVVGTWAVFREGINVLSTAAISGPAPVAGQVTNATQQAGQAVTQIHQGGPLAQGTANILSGLSLRTWGGVLLGLITAIFGGWAGRARYVEVQAQQAPPGPARLVA